MVKRCTSWAPRGTLPKSWLTPPLIIFSAQLVTSTVCARAAVDARVRAISVSTAFLMTPSSSRAACNGLRPFRPWILSSGARMVKAGFWLLFATAEALMGEDQVQADGRTCHACGCCGTCAFGARWGTGAIACRRARAGGAALRCGAVGETGGARQLQPLRRRAAWRHRLRARPRARVHRDATARQGRAPLRPRCGRGHFPTGGGEIDSRATGRPSPVRSLRPDAARAPAPGRALRPAPRADVLHRPL